MGRPQGLVLLDTHVLLWFFRGDEHLGHASRQVIDERSIEGTVLLSSFSYWEVGMLVRKSRLEVDVARLRKHAQTGGMQEIPVDGAIALTSTALPQFHGDPADRILVATALAMRATLITADAAILKWRPRVLTAFDARS